MSFKTYCLYPEHRKEPVSLQCCPWVVPKGRQWQLGIIEESHCAERSKDVHPPCTGYTFFPTHSFFREINAPSHSPKTYSEDVYLR